MVNTLVLITSNFPFGAGESFLDTEFPFLTEEFRKILIISCNTTDKQARITQEHVRIFRYRTSTSITGWISMPFLILKEISVIKGMIREEMNYRKDIGFPVSVRQRLFLLKKVIKAIQFRNFISDKLNDENITSDIVFYSYWLKSGAHALCLLNYGNSIKISRAHGSDLYEEKSKYCFLPLLKFTADRLNAIFFISEDGREYFKKKTVSNDSNLFVSRLGVIAPYKYKEIINKGIFTIVSCSNLIRLKRVDLIIEALSLMEPEKEVKWIHIGDGMLRNNLERTAIDLLGKKPMISFEFRGQIPNNEVLEFYSRNMVNLFINTSSTEGVPVSIMEAQSYGIPVIATDVGGVHEIISEKTGFLLPVDFSAQYLAEKINVFLTMDPATENVYRKNCFVNWNDNFNAPSNYQDFIKKVNRIFTTLIK